MIEHKLGKFPQVRNKIPNDEVFCNFLCGTNEKPL